MSVIKNFISKFGSLFMVIMGLLLVQSCANVPVNYRHAEDIPKPLAIKYFNEQAMDKANDTSAFDHMYGVQADEYGLSKQGGWQAEYQKMRYTYFQNSFGDYVINIGPKDNEMSVYTSRVIDEGKKSMADKLAQTLSSLGVTQTGVTDF